MSAARISIGTVESESWNAWALPWNVLLREAGIFNWLLARSIASVAWPSAVPCARLKLMVIAGNRPWGLIERGWAGVGVHLAKAAICSWPPVVGDRTKIWSRVAGLPCREGSTSMIT